MLIFNKNKLKAEIAELEVKKSQLIADTGKMEQIYDDLMQKADSAQSRYNELIGQISVIETKQEYGIPFYDMGIGELQAKRYYIQRDMDAAIAKGLYKITTQYLLNDSAAKGKELQNAIGAGLTYAINSYCADKERRLTTENLKKRKELISKKFDGYQKKAGKVGLALNSAYIKKRMEIMDVNLAIKVKEKEEKARIREEKRRLREQEQLLEEIARERKRLEDEKKNLQKLFDRAITENDQNGIKEKLAKIDKRIKDIDWRASHASAGWLYIATTKAMPGIYKAGCTRRLNPLTRLSELSSASVPFVFECKGLVFSEQVFDLEAKLHNRLDEYRVNKENTRKEFFYGEPEEVIKMLRDEFGVEVHFVEEDWFEENV